MRNRTQDDGDAALKEILGVHNDDAAFAAFLTNWRTILDARAATAIGRISATDGVAGLILAGSLGTGQPWPLSDIDLLPIYRDDRHDEAVAEVESCRLELLDEWSRPGWRSGLDIGRLRFTTGELERAFTDGAPDPVTMLDDERWYHSIDKGYGSRAVFETDGWATILARWFTRHRFDPDVVAVRIHRSAEAAQTCLHEVDVHLAAQRRDRAFASFLKAVQWHQIRLMEAWGERDNSLGRFGTRFERTAIAYGKGELAKDLNHLSGLDETSVRHQLDQAPRWVTERRDRSWAARQHIGEDVTMLQNDQDVLRVATIYGLRELTGPPYPPWLGIPEADADLRDRARRLAWYLAMR